MNIGDIVRWRSRRGVREGEIIAIVPAGADVRQMIPAVTPGLRPNDPRIRSPLVIHDRERFLVRVWRSGGLHWGIPYRTNELDFAYYTPTVTWLQNTGEVILEGTAAHFSNDGVKDGIYFTIEAQRRTSCWAERVGSAGHTVLLLTKRPDLLEVDVLWPQNVHLGVSVTASTDAWRIATLLDKAQGWKKHGGPSNYGGHRGPGVLWASIEPLLDAYFDPRCLAGLDWVVVGLQTGPHAKSRLPPIHAVRSIREWCADNSVPLFVKDSAVKMLGGTWPREYPRAENAPR
jgi:hypothetical protein